MARPCHSLNTARIAARGEDLSKLSSEVLKLCLQVQNLPIMSFKVQLLARLKRASTGKASQSKQRPGRPRLTCPLVNKTPMEQVSTAAVSRIDTTQVRCLIITKDSALSDRVSLSSIEDTLQSDVEEDVFETNQCTDQRDALSPVQHSAIQDIVSQSVQSALHTVGTTSVIDSFQKWLEAYIVCVGNCNCLSKMGP